MFQNDLNAVAQAAQNKARLLKNNPLGYWISAMLAGLFIGFGVILVFTVGGFLAAAGSPFTKPMMGLLFGGALSLVLMAGAELFTGNTMILAVGSFQKQVSWRQTAVTLLCSYVGNLLGALALSALMAAGELYGPEASAFVLSSAEAKMSAPALQLFIAGILCNILVCLPVWCSFRLKSESAKLIMVFWGIVMFIVPGFEHCVANMTLLSSALLLPHGAGVSLAGFFRNILITALGNIIGGAIVVGGGYCMIGRTVKK